MYLTSSNEILDFLSKTLIFSTIAPVANLNTSLPFIVNLLFFIFLTSLKGDFKSNAPQVSESPLLP
jgi:ABC-type methionine transport system permease subunit